MHAAHDTIAGLVASYGYLVLFAIVAIESLGIPLPGETALVTAAALAALGRLNIIAVIATATAAAVVGDNAGYWIGRAGGHAFVRRYGRHVGLDEAKVARVHAFFERHGGKTVFIARFVALLRSWTAAMAGASNMSYGTFTLYNALGGLCWAAVFGVLGYVFGRNLPLLQRYAAQASLAATLLLVLIVCLTIAARWFWHRREAIAERVALRWQRVATDERFADFRRRHSTLWSFVAARFARGEYLGLHLTVGLILSVAALWLFGGVTEDVIHHDPLTQLDLNVVTWFRAHSTPALDRIGVSVSLIGSPVAMAILAVVVAIVLAARRQWILLGGWAGVFAGGGLLDWTLKIVIQRPRPSGAAAFLHGESFSFPSGHAMGSLFGYGMLAYLVARFYVHTRRARLTIIVAAAVLIVAIGLSRLYLGVHYFSDVVAGYAAGLVWLLSCISGVEVALGRRAHFPWEVGLERRVHPRPSVPDHGVRNIARAGAVLVLLAFAITGCGRSIAPAYHGAVSDHFDGKRFFNYERTPERQLEDAIRREEPGRHRGHWDDWQETPTDTPPPRVAGGELRVTFVNHATVLVQTERMNVLIDPVWSERVSPFAWYGPKRHRPPGIQFDDLPPIDLVLLSHNHYDHMDLPTLHRLVTKFHPRIVTGLGNTAFLSKNGITGSEDIDWWQAVAVAPGVRLTGVPARHWSARALNDVDRTLWLGFVLETPAGRIYFAGDTGYGQFFALIHERFPSFRLGLLPIAPARPRDTMAPRHMSAGDAVRAAELLHVATSIAIHYGTFQQGEDGQNEPVDSLTHALAAQPSLKFFALRNGEARWIEPGVCDALAASTTSCPRQ